MKTDVGLYLLTPLALQNHRTESKRLVHKQPCCEHLSSDCSFFWHSKYIRFPFFLLFFSFLFFFFLFFYKKASKKQFICYSIAVKNACFCWLIECIVAPSIHALTARVATANVKGIISIFFTSRWTVSCRTCYTHITTFKHQKVDEKLVTKANNFLIAAFIRLL